MIFHKMKFDPRSDRCPVTPDQAVDIGLAIAAGRIPADIGPDPSAYNSIENPADIVGDLPRDVFDAIGLSQKLQRYGVNVPDAGGAAPEAPAAPATSQE